MKKLEKRLSVLLTLLILLPSMMVALPISLNSLVVRAASSAAITLSKSEGYVGDYVTVSGSGFTPNKDVKFMWGDNLFSSLGFIASPGYQRPSLSPVGSGAQVHTDALGNFKVQLQVPELTSGTYTIKATDTQNSAITSFTINPLIKLVNEYAYKTQGNVQTPSDNPSSAYYIGLFLTEGFVNDRLGLQLSGFGLGETVQVRIGNASLWMGSSSALSNFIVGTTVTTEGYLFQSAAARVPNLSGGTYTVTATGTASGITASTTFTIEPELFLAMPFTTITPPSGLGWDANWVYYYSDSGGTLGAAWYTSIGTTANSPIAFEATGLTGTSISTVTISLLGQTMVITPTGTLTLQTGTGATQGISTSTLPYVYASPFGPNSPVARTTGSLSSGQMINVTVTTSGTGAASFTFTGQLFSSTPSTSGTGGTLVWTQGQSTIASNGSSLSGFVGDKDKLVITGLTASASSLDPLVVYASGSTVQEQDIDALAAWPLTLYVQEGTGATPLCFYDSNGNGVWEVGKTVYVNNANNGVVTAGDVRVTALTLQGTTYWPWSTVAATDPDVGRPLVKFPDSSRPAYHILWPYEVVYLEEDANSFVSAGDIRISPVLLLWSFGASDLNGFAAYTLNIPSIPGGGLQYNVGLWNREVGTDGVEAGNTIAMTIMPQITVTAPTSYQSTQYVTQGSSVTLSGNGFFGNEPITISVAGKYVTTPTPPSSFGVLGSTAITMPALAGGEQTITVQGVFTTENTASANVTVTPTLSVTPGSAYNLNPLTQIAVTGTGFAAGTYNIVFDGAVIGETVVSGLTVNGTGNFAGQINAAFNAPTGVEGNHIIDVVNTLNTTKSAFYGASYFTTAGSLRDTTYPSSPTTTEFPTVTIQPSLQAAPTSTIVGTTITVTGKGLQPSMTYYIWYDPRDDSSSEATLVATTPATVTTDAEGTLMASFQIPSSSGGTRYLWVSTSNTYVDNDPVSGNLVYNHVYIEPAITLGQSSGTVGSSVAVSFTGLSYGGQYQLWWYQPGEAVLFDGGVNIPGTALLLGTATGALYGNSTAPVTFTVPATAETGTVYAVDLAYYGNRYSALDNPVFFTVGKIATTITLSLTPNVVTQGDKVAINGLINPAMSVNVILFITAPDGTSKNESVTSATSGTFTDTFTPNQSGTWQVTAQWAGNAVYSDYTSLAATITANPVDMTPTYELTALIIGIIALVIGLIVIVDLMRRRRVAPQTAPPT